MKPPPFEYDGPRSLEEALALLGEHGDEAKPLAGGQSLVPLLNFRLARPARLIDLNGIGDLAGLREENGVLRIGAMTRARALERSELVAAGWPLLRDAVRFVGHAAIRNRGTVGGSAAHADPAAELPAALLALGARFRLQSMRGARVVDAQDFFRSVFTTALEADELLTEIEVPPLPPGTGSAFVEHARVHGDFALAGAAALVTVTPNGTAERATLVLLAAADRPVRAEAAESVVRGRRLDETGAREAAARAIDGIEPTPSIAAGREYRRALSAELACRALLAAAGRAG